MHRAMTLTSIPGALLALVLTGPGALAQEESFQRESFNGAGHPLVGSWLIDALPEVEGNPPAITTFHADGSVGEVGGEGAAGAGAWRPTSERGADATIIIQMRDPDGSFLGLQVIRVSLEASEDGGTLSGTWTLEPPAAVAEGMGLPAGELGPGEVRGQRIEVEPPGEPVAPVPAGPPPAE